MYRLLIVDDEEIEREGMAQLIQWSKYGIELVGTAWNGVEGFEKIQTEKPDIVLTDIKMPVMNGIEMIRKTRKSDPNVEFIVLSGYGEFEYTSQAMQEGVRHYVLKPCDEEKIVGVLDGVKAEIDKKREKQRQEKRYLHTVHRLLPRAKEQVFRNMLLNGEGERQNYDLFLQEYGNKELEIVVLGLRIENGFDYLEQFIMGNVLQELLGEEHIHLTTSIEQDVLFLIDTEILNEIEPAVERANQEFKRIRAHPIQAALSEIGRLETVSRLYQQILQLLKMGSLENQTGLLHYGLFLEIQNDAELLVDYKRIKEARDYGEILFEISLAFMKMEMQEYSFRQKEEICEWSLKVLYGITNRKILEGKEDVWELLEGFVNIIADRQGVAFGMEKDEQRVKKILIAIFRYIWNPKMNIQFLAKEVLFMNEDYFGRIFVKNRKIKFSAYLLEQRILLAQRLLQYRPELKISCLAEMVGYSPDGQYFSKAFRKVVGMSPKEYREQLKEE